MSNHARTRATCASYSSHKHASPFQSLSDPMVTSGALLPMTSLISPRADLTLKSQCVTSSAPIDETDTQFNGFSTFAILAFSRCLFGASCEVTATACSGGVVFSEILLGKCCSLVLIRTSLSSCGPLFVAILSLMSDPDELGCPALFPHTTSWPRSSPSCAGPFLLSRQSSLLVLVVSLVCAPDPDDSPYVAGMCGGRAIFFEG